MARTLPLGILPNASPTMAPTLTPALAQMVRCQAAGHRAIHTVYEVGPTEELPVPAWT